MKLYRAFWAVTLLVLWLMGAGCDASRTVKGAAIGTAAGAAVGTAVGAPSGHKKEGAVIGAVAGGVTGGVIGRRLDQQAKELQAVAEAKRTEQGILVTLANNILFDVNKSQLKPEAKEQLQQIAAIMKKYPEDLVVAAGHTDSDGAAEYNMKLSEARSNAVKTYLIANGVPSSSVQAVGFGETQPTASNNTSDGKQLNRRVELVITVDQSKVPPEK